MRKRIGILVSGIFLGFVLSFFVRSTQNTVTDKAVTDDFKEHYHIYALPLPDSMYFAGERVPVEKPWVRERLDRELLVNVYWQSYALLKFKRARKYFPLFEPILQRYGIPEDFKYLAVAESNLEPVVSPAGAAGIWQLMKGTARKYGLIVDKEIDQRYDPWLATEAACRYLAEARQQFGSWTLAAAAYNRGRQGLQKALDDQGATGYYDLYLNPETAKYIYRIAAIKEIMEHPQDYGFHFREKDLYHLPELRKVMVDTAVSSWPGFARKFGLTYGQLRYYNPFIRDYQWANKNGDTLYVYLPAQ